MNNKAIYPGKTVSKGTFWAAVLACALAAPVQAGEKKDTPAFLDMVRIDGEATTLYTATAPVKGVINPDNTIKGIETGNWFNVARLRATYRDRLQGIKLRVEPWVSFERHFFDHVGNAHTYNEENIQIGRYQAKYSGLIPATTLAAQRGIVAWGPAFLGSPSNPFPDNSSTSNALEEEFGTDFIWASHAFDNSWSVSAYNNYSRGAADSVDSNPFQKAFTGAIHYNGYSHSLSAVAGSQEDFGPIYGAYGQWTMSEAMVSYFDLGYRKRGLARYPVADSSNLLGGSYNEGQADRDIELVAGGSYTTKDDTTFYAEYMYLGAGYDDDELDLAHDIALNARTFRNTAPTLADGTLGEAALNELPYLGQHIGSLVATKSIGDFDMTLQNQWSFQDFSGQLFGGFTYSHGAAKFSVSALQTYGRQSGAFRQDLDTRIITGLMIRY